MLAYTIAVAIARCAGASRVRKLARPANDRKRFRLVLGIETTGRQVEAIEHLKRGC